MKSKFFKRSMALFLVTLTMGGSLNSITYAGEEGVKDQSKTEQPETEQSTEDFILKIQQLMGVADGKIRQFSTEINNIDDIIVHILNKYGTLEEEACDKFLPYKIYSERRERKKEALEYWKQRKKALEKCFRQAQTMQKRETKLNIVKREKALQAKEALEKNATLKKPENEERKDERIKKLESKIRLQQGKLNTLKEQIHDDMEKEKTVENLFLEKEGTSELEIEYSSRLRSLITKHWIPQIEELMFKMSQSGYDWYRTNMHEGVVFSEFLPYELNEYKNCYISVINSFSKEQFNNTMSELLSQISHEMEQPFCVKNKSVKEQLEEVFGFVNKCINYFKGGFDYSMESVELCSRACSLVSNIHYILIYLHDLKDQICRPEISR